MMIPTAALAGYSAVAVVAVLGSASLVNIGQTIRQTKSPRSRMSSATNSQPLSLPQVLSLSRKESIQLFLQSDWSSQNSDGVWNNNHNNNSNEIPATRTILAPVLDLEGEWQGALLDNHGPIMVRIGDLRHTVALPSLTLHTQTLVTKFLTHVLFGPTWMGKEFFRNGKGGINVFLHKKKHTFDVLHGAPSRLDSKGSLCLEYHKYQGRWSLWRTMRDELRVVPAQQHYDVLIGMGSMAWSGGMLNASPFCLWRHKRNGTGI